MIRVPLIKGQAPRILLISQDYFIIPELRRAFKGLGIAHAEVEFRQSPEFLKELFDRVQSFRPHFILTVNHAGLDAQGQVLDLLNRCGVPFASWFVDRHEQYLHSAVDPDSLLAVFSWDPDAVQPLRDLNVPYARYLPLATDPSIFHPRNEPCGPQYPVSFVGSSWTGKIADVLRAGKFPAVLVRAYPRLGRLLESDYSQGVPSIMQQAGADVRRAFDALEPDRRTMYFRLAQLYATRLRRVNDVSRLLCFKPVIVGDSYWSRVLARSGGEFTWIERLPYEVELPAFYCRTAVNFNATSLQSLSSLNQRVFDVPGCGAFLLTEHSAALEKLFDPGREVACYSHADSVPDVISRWLDDEKGRQEIAHAAMKRVLAQHTYRHRIVQIISSMRRFF